MRKFLVLGAIALVIFAGLPGHAEQEHSGSILVPTTGTETGQGIFWGYIAAACARSQGANGTFGHVIQVTPNASFGLGDASPVPVGIDFDIQFYTSEPGCVTKLPDSASQHTNGFGNESGTVPGDSSWAIIILYAGAPGSTFVYADN